MTSYMCPGFFEKMELYENVILKDKMITYQVTSY